MITNMRLKIPDFLQEVVSFSGQYLVDLSINHKYLYKM